MAAQPGIDPVGEVEQQGGLPAFGLSHRKALVVEMMVEHRLRLVAQGGEFPDKEIAVDRVVPDPPGLEEDHVVHLVGLVGADVVQHRQDTQIQHPAGRAAHLAQHVADEIRHPFAVVDEPPVEPIQGASQDGEDVFSENGLQHVISFFWIFHVPL